MTPLTVLIVDDDAESADELAELLELSGYRACVAHSLAQARLLREENTPDCALIDVQLGRENGLDLALEWQKETKPQVVLLSGAQLTQAQTALFPSPPPLLMKPASLQDLAAFLEATRPDDHSGQLQAACHVHGRSGHITGAL